MEKMLYICGMSNSRIAKAYDILKEYNGTNRQILYYKHKLEEGHLILEEFDTKYILKNHDYKPIELSTDGKPGKIVSISNDLGLELQEKYGLEFVPSKLKVYEVIGEMGASYHCYAQYRQSVPKQLMYLKKRCVLTQLVTVDYNSLDIDFDVYDNMPSNQGRKLKEHQKSGAKFLVANKKCILADSMGTGKTITSIVATLAGGYKNILVITTASLKTSWKKDMLFYVPEDEINIVSGSKWTPGKKFTVINYDIIDNFYEIPLEPEFETQVIKDKDGNVVDTFQVPVMVRDKKTGEMVQKMKKSTKKADILESLGNSPLFLEDYDCVIIDEAQKLSNSTSNRYKCIYDFLRKSDPKAIFLLTGTPLTNSPMNLYQILRLIDAEVTWDYRYYVERYCSGREMKLRDGRKIMKPGKASNLNELREKIKNIYIRRLASETGEMVGKTITRRYYDLTEAQKSKYEALWREYTEAQADSGLEQTSDDYRQLVEGMLVRQYLAKEMTKNTISLADDIIAYGDKVVIITCFQEEMDIFKKHYGKKCVVYNGKMLPNQKDKAQREFMENPDVKVFIGQIIACGVGLSIPIANKLIFNSYDWVAANNKQAEDRIYRLTQTRDVECIYQLFTDSVSQDMFDKVIYKELITNQTIKSEKEKLEGK